MMGPFEQNKFSLLKAVCDLAVQPIVVGNRSGELVYSNKAFQTLCKQLSVRCESLFQWRLAHSNTVLREFCQHSLDNASENTTLDLLTNDGLLIPAHLIRFPKTHAIQGVVLMLQPLEASSPVSKTQKLAALTQISQGLIQELGNPLNALWSLLNSVSKQTRADDPRYEFLNAMHADLDRILRVTNGLQEFARSGKVRFAKVSCSAILNHTLGFSAFQLEKAGIVIARSFAKDLWSVLGSKNGLQQVFLNIILNAYEAMPKGGKLDISANNLAGPRVQIAFEDSGCGIEPQHLPRIFEPFFSHGKGEHRTGLGLAICHGIITHHQGTITVTSRTNRGSQFVIELPACSS